MAFSSPMWGSHNRNGRSLKQTNRPWLPRIFTKIFSFSDQKKTNKNLYFLLKWTEEMRRKLQTPDMSWIFSVHCVRVHSNWQNKWQRKYREKEKHLKTFPSFFFLHLATKWQNILTATMARAEDAVIDDRNEWKNEIGEQHAIDRKLYEKLLFSSVLLSLRRFSNFCFQTLCFQLFDSEATRRKKSSKRKIKCAKRSFSFVSKVSRMRSHSLHVSLFPSSVTNALRNKIKSK